MSAFRMSSYSSADSRQPLDSSVNDMAVVTQALHNLGVEKSLESNSRGIVEYWQTGKALCQTSMPDGTMAGTGAS